MSTRYTAAIVGCGGIGHAHMEGYDQFDSIEVIGAVDPIETAREQYREAFGIPHAYASGEEMMKEIKPDIVSVCVWHLLHPDMTIAAAEGGAKAVICEKPMAIGVGDAERMIDACTATGTRLVISHQHRLTHG